MELYQLTAHELHDKLKAKEISSAEIVKSVLANIGAVEGKVKAFMTVTEDEAYRMAEEAEVRFSKDKGVTPLTGIPVVVKDNMCSKGIPTTCSSKILSDFRPPYDATVVERLKDAGAVIIGKANMDEFAMGSSNENSAFGATRNPWDLDHVPGGSSGGPVAAVAADEGIVALGSDTGGSIRQPASLCGVVGFKPTYGRVSRYGLVAFASSLDQIGPITKDVTDCALTMNIISGRDRRDATSAEIPVPDYTESLKDDVRGIRIGIPTEYFVEGLDKEVEGSIRAAIAKYEELGATCVDISLPHTDYAVAVYYVIATAEASSNLARFDGVQYGYRSESPQTIWQMYGETKEEGFGPEVKRRIMLGTYVLSSGYYNAYYLKAQKVRTLIKNDFIDAFKDVDVILTPTSPTPAFKIGEKVDDPLQMYLSDILTIPANLAGLPAISLPCGFTANNLPLGLQLLAPFFAEDKIIQAAYAFEGNTDYHLRKPEL